MKAGRPTLLENAQRPCSTTVQEIINGEQPPHSTVSERRMAARLLLDIGVDRKAIAFLLGVNVKTINRYGRSEPR